MSKVVRKMDSIKDGNASNRSTINGLRSFGTGLSVLSRSKPGQGTAFLDPRVSPHPGEKSQAQRQVRCIARFAARFSFPKNLNRTITMALLIIACCSFALSGSARALGQAHCDTFLIRAVPINWDQELKGAIRETWVSDYRNLNAISRQALPLSAEDAFVPHPTPHIEKLIASFYLTHFFYRKSSRTSACSTTFGTQHHASGNGMVLRKWVLGGEWAISQFIINVGSESARLGLSAVHPYGPKSPPRDVPRLSSNSWLRYGGVGFIKWPQVFDKNESSAALNKGALRSRSLRFADAYQHQRENGDGNRAKSRNNGGQHRRVFSNKTPDSPHDDPLIGLSVIGLMFLCGGCVIWGACRALNTP